MRALSFFISFLGLFFAVMVCAEWNISDSFIFFDPPMIFCFLVIYAGMITGTRNFKTLLSGINGALSEKYRMTGGQRDDAVALFKLLRSTTNYTAGLLVLIPFMLLMLNLDDPSTFGPKVAMALMSLTYGAAINLLLINPAIYLLQKKQTGDEPVPEVQTAGVRPQANRARSNASAFIKDKDAAEKLLRLCFEKGITHEEIMNADDITLRDHI